jgi:hypothetical protein
MWMKYDMNGNLIPEEKIETDREFWKVPVTIISTIWEDGYHIYEANSMDEALECYHSEKAIPFDIEYCGQQDQEYRYDELDGDMPEQLDTNSYEVQEILIQERKRKEWLEERAEKERRDRLV